METSSSQCFGDIINDCSPSENGCHFDMNHPNPFSTIAIPFFRCESLSERNTDLAFLFHDNNEKDDESTNELNEKPSPTSNDQLSFPKNSDPFPSVSCSQVCYR